MSLLENKIVLPKESGNETLRLLDVIPDRASVDTIVSFTRTLGDDCTMEVGYQNNSNVHM
jgi:hypothetical protein